ncbi:MAG: Gfo/Idh/MocA family oxidoreductase [bacterium]|nr:Gfo/Idh/MocA family oxidoreductase [bacterium]
MRCLLGNQWTDTTLDYYRSPGSYRIQVWKFANLDQLSGIYFVPERDLRLLWNYVREVGAVGVWRKVASRLQERNRNEKFLSLGVGEIVECPRETQFEPGTRVVFVAPGFPACIERVALPEAFLAALPIEATKETWGNSVRHLKSGDPRVPRPVWLEKLKSWSPYSGADLDEAGAKPNLNELLELEAKIDWSAARELPVERISEVRESVSTPPPPRRTPRTRKRKRAVLFGYGHYAKTNILPNVKKHIKVDSIHEIDPTQIPPDRADARCWDTAPVIRKSEDFDVFLIAGFHHTHAPLAVAALNQGAFAVVEKPLTVDRAQLNSLATAVERTKGGFFGCFHKRYSTLNNYAITDLRQSPEQPIDYHCIVYEVPLPNHHWYRWPNSKSRLISNGCHWIDHFLYLNGYKKVESIDLGVSPSGTIHCAATLKNGAYFTMTLTEKGSSRIGVQDYVELRAGQITATIVNNSSYLAEGRGRILRRTRVNKLGTYKLMYRNIAECIARGEGGDSIQSVRVSNQLVLDFEDALNDLNRNGG